MKQILLLLISLLVIQNVTAQWTIKHVNEDSNNSGTLKFKNDSVGLFMGEWSSILKTMDEGENWEQKSIDTYGEVNILDFQFVGVSSVFAVGIDYYSKALNSVLIQSNDLGENWERISNFLDEYLESVWFFNIDSGIIAGSDGIYRTIDGGISLDTVWSISLLDYKFGEVRKVFFPTPDVGYAIGYGLSKETNQFDNFLLKSTDSGKTWDTINASMDSNLPPASYIGAGLLSVYFINQDTGFVGTEGGYILKTIDGGSSWTETRVNDYCEIRSIQFISETEGFAVGGVTFYIALNGERNLSNDSDGLSNFVISKTTDGGETWESYDSLGVELSSVYFINDTVGFVSGNYELIMKSDGKNLNELPEDYPWHLFYDGGSDVENKLISTNIKVYPNPIRDILTIQITNLSKEINSVSLINAFGQTFESRSSRSNIQNIHFDMSDYSPGMYFIRVDYDDKTEIAKIIKK